MATTVTVPSAFATNELPLNVTKSAPVVTSYVTSSVESTGVTVGVNVTEPPTSTDVTSAARVIPVAGTTTFSNVVVPRTRSWLTAVLPLLSYVIARAPLIFNFPPLAELKISPISAVYAALSNLIVNVPSPTVAEAI